MALGFFSLGTSSGATSVTDRRSAAYVDGAVCDTPIEYPRLLRALLRHGVAAGNAATPGAPDSRGDEN